MKKALTLLFVLAGLKMFAQTAEPNFSLSAVESSKTWLDIDYVGDGIIGHKLDIFLPKKGKAPFPIIVTIYGSAWFSNSAKGSCFKDGFGQALLKNGFAVVSINHRSSADAVWPAQLHDIKAAVRFIRANATKFSLDSSFVGVTGFSSGGHLSTMLGVTSNLKNAEIGYEMQQITNAQGKINFTALSLSGSYDIYLAESNEYYEVSKTGIILISNKNSNVFLALRP